MNRGALGGVFDQSHGMNTMNAFTSLRLASVVSLLGASVGCVIVDQEPPPDPYGDIAFSWSFDGITDCDVAGVDELDIAIFQGGQLITEIDQEPCVGGGLVLTDFLNGRYELEIDAYNRRSELLYSGGFSIRVEGGRENDAGVVVFEPLFERPPSTGDLAFFWAFNYPADEPIISCGLAGVTAVDVRLDGPGGAEITETFDCSEDGAIFGNLEEGRWTVSLDAYGRYRNQDVHLYDGSFTVDVIADREVDLGDLALDRDESSFSDIEVEWGFNGTSCDAEGIVTLQLAIERDGLDEPEDITTVDCADLTDLRRTFVPGTYTISLNGVGADADWHSAAVIDLAPNTLAVVPLQLAPDA